MTRNRTKAEREREEKDARRRQRACFDEELTHIRVGWWQGEVDDDAVVLVGLLRDLHGTACTCCPRTTSTTSTETQTAPTTQEPIAL